MLDLYSYSLPAIFFMSVAVVLAICELGWQIGTRGQSHAGDNVTTLESGMLGLLALLIGFTFAMALSRFEARRDAVLHEANAIGTTALRARLLPDPHRSETLKLLKEYIQIRVGVAESGHSLAELNAAIDRSNAVQEALWIQTKALAAQDHNAVPTGVFIQSLNEMIDAQAKRLSALRNRVPNLVLLGLFGFAAVAGGFAGYVSGLSEERTRWPVYILGALVCSVIVLILDLDRPSSGFITNNQQAMIDTAASIAAFPEIAR